MRVTIDDVAKAAGVSRSTASRALSGHPAVLPETRDRVYAVAEEMHYRVDPVARALRAGNSGLIGLVLTNLVNHSIQQIAETVQARAHDAGLEVVIATTNGDADRERRVIGTLTSHRVDGLVVMGSNDAAPLLNSLYAGGLPMVGVVRSPSSLLIPSVVYDDESAGRLAAEHLLDAGHRRIAYLGGPPSTRSGRLRYQGFEAALRARGLAPATADVFQGEFESAFGSVAILRFLAAESRATAIVIANHEAMFGALQVLSTASVSVPEDLSVVTIEDDPLLRYWHPSITTIDTLPERLAELAITAMLSQLANGTDEEVTPTVMPVHLIERASTRRI